MKFGMMKVCAATPALAVADCAHNANVIIDVLSNAEQRVTDVVVFPQLSICGNTCGDLFHQSALLHSAEQEIIRICKSTKKLSLLCFVGAPVFYQGKLYNCAIAIQQGNVLAVIPKSTWSNNGVLNERKFFSRAFNGVKKIAYANAFVPFGRDILFTAEQGITIACELDTDVYTPLAPNIAHVMAGAQIIFNLCAEAETAGKAKDRILQINALTQKLACGYVLSNAGVGESTTDMAFAGHSFVSENGVLLAQNTAFDGECVYADIDVERIKNARLQRNCEFEGVDNEYTVIPFMCKQNDSQLDRKIDAYPFLSYKDLVGDAYAQQVLQIQSAGLQKRLQHTRTKDVVLGISGGLDSTLALLVVCRAFEALKLNKSGIHCYTMPCFGTSQRTQDNSMALANALGCSIRTICIGNTVQSHFNDIGHECNDHSVTFENAQARIRTLVLMDTANKVGGLVIGTGDLSEAALGWATFNGDHMSMYNVNCSIPKTLVKLLVAYEAKRLAGEAERVLNDILATEISPELLPPDKDGKIAQKTEDIVGPYELHDFFLYQIVQCGFVPEKIIYLAKNAFAEKYDEQTIKKWLLVFYKRFFAQQFKRSCMPDGIQATCVSLSPRGAWQMPSDAIVNEWIKAFS